MANYNADTFRELNPAWSAKGYSGSGNVVNLIDSLRGQTAIVVGNARGFQDEAARFPDAVVFAVNDSGMYLPQVHHWVSLHSTRLSHWVEIRRDKYGRSLGNKDFITHDAGKFAEWRADFQWSGISPLFALSGYFAMQVAYLMGAEKIILCGCPGDFTPCFFEGGEQSRNPSYGRVGVADQVKKEMARLPEFKVRVRSCSGSTKEFFGGPNG